MYTYQDLAACGEDERKRTEFIAKAIAAHEASELYRTAQDAEDYYAHRNPTIMRAQKMVYDLMGRAVPDIYSANNKIPCRYYFYFVTQAVQYLLGNGVSFGDAGTKAKLGNGFDEAVQKAATLAVNDGVAFGYWNHDHLEVFGVSRGGSKGGEPVFVPLYDEDTGMLRAGIRYWRIATDKPLRVTMYEENGVTEYIQRPEEKMRVHAPKRGYIRTVAVSDVGGTEIASESNYPTFPIVPLWNVNKQSEIVGGKEVLDAYDLMASALVNNIDEANLIYWVLKNCGGMTDMDDVKFLERLKTTHVAHADGDDAGASVEAHKIEAPYDANEAALERLRTQLFDDFMALDVKEIASGAATATQIRAAYEPLNSKTDLLEYQVTAFIRGILKIAGIDDMPTYTRSTVVNQQEEITTIVAAASYLSSDYITRRILDVLGDTDKAEDVLKAVEADEYNRFGFSNENE